MPVDSPAKIRIDCHCHTCASWDSLIDYPQFIADVQNTTLDGVVICDHNTLDGAKALQDLSPPFRVIPGMEINTMEGELLGFFLHEVVPAGLSLPESIQCIHEQGGLVVIPHPFAPHALHRVRTPRLLAIAHLVDALEGINARNEAQNPDDQAVELAARLGKPVTAGSDVHMPGRVGSAYLEIEPFSDAADFLAKLPAARTVLVRRASTWKNLLGFSVAMTHRLLFDQFRNKRR